MKKCSYCGAEYPDDAVMCAIDHTPFAAEAQGEFSEGLRWPPKSAFGLAFTGGLGALLICTGVFFVVGRIERDITRMYQVGDTGVPASYDIVDFHHAVITYSLFMVGALLFTFFACYNRCLRESHGIITALITFAVIFLQTIGHIFISSFVIFLYFVPVLVFGIALGSPIFFYVGGALQVLIGAWLLGWFRHRRTAA